jgi:hypothetical protein
MGMWQRFGVTALVAVGLGAGCWLIVVLIGDRGDAVAAAAAMTGLVGTLGGAWSTVGGGGSGAGASADGGGGATGSVGQVISASQETAGFPPSEQETPKPISPTAPPDRDALPRPWGAERRTSVHEASSRGAQQRQIKPATEPPFPANAGALPSSAKQVRQPLSQTSPQPRSTDRDPMRCLYEPIRELHNQSAEIRKLLPITRARRIVLKMIIPAVESNLEKLKCVDPAEWPGDTTWAASFSRTLSNAADKLRDVESDLRRGLSPGVIDLLHVLDQLYQMAAESYPQILLS